MSLCRRCLSLALSLLLFAVCDPRVEGLYLGFRVPLFRVCCLWGAGVRDVRRNAIDGRRDVSFRVARFGKAAPGLREDSFQVGFFERDRDREGGHFKEIR